MRKYKKFKNKLARKKNLKIKMELIKLLFQIH